LAYSSLVYCVEIYGRAKQSVLHALKVKCLLRLLQDKPRMFSTKLLYSNYNTLPVNLLYKLYVLKLMHRFVYSRDELPIAITDLFSANNDIHSYNTRHKHEFNLNSNICVNSLSFIGPSLWLKLPRNLTECSSLTVFIKLCKNTLLDDV